MTAIIWDLLVLGPVILFGLLAATWDDSIRLTALRAILWFALASLIGTEALGAFGAISAETIRLYWFAVSLGLVTAIAIRLRGGSPFRTRWPQLRFFAPYGPWIILILAVTLFIAMTAIPNNGDTMAYHLAKIEHWLQNKTLAFYPTHDDRQNDLGPLAEILILQWRAITGGDHWSLLEQWLAMAGSLAGVSLIAARLGGSVRAQFLSVLFCATLPMGILQSTTADNDYLTAFFLICFIERIVVARRNYRPAPTVEAALSIALAILTKPTALIWGLPFGLWFVAPLLRQPRKAVWILALFAICAAVPFAGHYGRLIRQYGTPIPPVSRMTNNASFGVGQMLDNLLLQSASELAVPYDRMNWYVLQAVNRTSAILHLSAHRADTIMDAKSFDRTDLCQLCPKGRFVLPSVPSVELPSPWLLLSEMFASNPLHYIIGLASVAAALTWLIRRQQKELGWYALCCIGALIVFVILVRWQVWITRLHLPILVAISPVAGIVGSQVRRFKLLVEFLALLLCVYSWPFLVEHRDLRLWPHPYLADDRDMTLFAERPYLIKPYTMLAARLRASGCNKIGLAVPSNFYEFPFWLMLRSQLQAGGRMEHVFPGLAVNYPLGAFHPGCIIYDNEEEIVSPTTFDGTHWRETFRASKVSLYERSAGN